jgi:type I restriction-modification system DNA methylase subunit
MKLVNEMLDKLPIEVWSDKNLKWLDPATGMGNFPVAVYLRLMEGLKEDIKDIKERKKHILENMLYMSELNKKNVLVCNQLFDINNEYKLNLYEGDSLKVNYEKEFGIKEFDIIMGNPPYQKNFKNNNSRVGGSSLWSAFINYSMNILKNNKYLLFITTCS